MFQVVVFVGLVTVCFAGKSCINDLDCEWFVELCQHETCQPHKAPCLTADECGDGEQCRYSYCGLPVWKPDTKQCTDDLQCTWFSELCQYEHCVTNGPACVTSNDCEAPQECRWSHCGHPVKAASTTPQSSNNATSPTQQQQQQTEAATTKTTTLSTTTTTEATTTKKTTLSATTAAQAGKSCMNDLDCVWFVELCQNETCQPHKAPCLTADDCGEGEQCRYSYCGLPIWKPDTKQCNDDLECTWFSELCQYGHCLTNGPACVTSNDCEAPQECRWSHCGHPTKFNSTTPPMPSTSTSSSKQQTEASTTQKTTQSSSTTTETETAAKSTSTVAETTTTETASTTTAQTSSPTTEKSTTTTSTELSSTAEVSTTQKTTQSPFSTIETGTATESTSTVAETTTAEAASTTTGQTSSPTTEESTTTSAGSTA